MKITTRSSIDNSFPSKGFKMVRATKEKNLLSFIFDDDTCAKYDLNDGTMYGRLGRIIKPSTMNSYFTGISVTQLIDLYDDPIFNSFLRDRACVKTTKIGSFLEQLSKDAHLEQFYAAGIRSVSSGVSKVPKRLLKLYRHLQEVAPEGVRVMLTHFRVSVYTEHQALIHAILDIGIPAMPEYLLINFLLSQYINATHTLVTNYRYDLRTLLSYYNEKLENCVVLKRHEYLVKSSVLLKDYARMSHFLNPSFPKYPAKLEDAHDAAMQNYNAFRQKHDEALFQSRYASHQDTVINNHYILAPRTTQDIKDEGIALHHCVGSYINEVIKGRSLILFFREDPGSPQLTLEVKNGQVVQAKGAYNRCPHHKSRQPLVF